MVGSPQLGVTVQLYFSCFFKRKVEIFSYQRLVYPINLKQKKKEEPMSFENVQIQIPFSGGWSNSNHF